jgi:site-specific recombinase XerD
MSLPVIGKLLGHTKSATTERYSRLAADPLKAANEAIGQQLAKLLGSG